MALWKSSVVIHNGNLGGNGTNTWHARTVAFSVELDVKAQLQALTDILEEDFYSGVINLFGGGTIVDFEALWVSVDEDEAVGYDVDGWTMTAPGATEIMAPQDCIVAGWRTSSPTKGGRGRTFLGPLKTAGVLDGNGTPSEAARATVEGAGLALIESTDTFGNGALGVYSRAGVVNPSAPGVFRDFTGIRIANKFGSLRSRRD